MCGCVCVCAGEPIDHDRVVVLGVVWFLRSSVRAPRSVRQPSWKLFCLFFFFVWTIRPFFLQFLLLKATLQQERDARKSGGWGEGSRRGAGHTLGSNVVQLAGLALGGDGLNGFTFLKQPLLPFPFPTLDSSSSREPPTCVCLITLV